MVKDLACASYMTSGLFSKQGLPKGHSPSNPTVPLLLAFHWQKLLQQHPPLSMHCGHALPGNVFVQYSRCLSPERLLRAGEGGGLGGREQSWELCGTQTHEPLVVGIRGSKAARDVSEEAQALLVLRRWQEMPGLGIQLVPEHVETRPLYHPRSPGLLQVKEGSGHIPRAPGLPPGPEPGHGHF